MYCKPNPAQHILYVMLCSIALTSHFPFGSTSVCLEANLGYVTQYGQVPPLCSNTALCSPCPLFKHREKRTRGGWNEYDDRMSSPLRFPPLTQHNHTLAT